MIVYYNDEGNRIYYDIMDHHCNNTNVKQKYTLTITVLLSRDVSKIATDKFITNILWIVDDCRPMTMRTSRASSLYLRC